MDDFDFNLEKLNRERNKNFSNYKNKEDNKSNKIEFGIKFVLTNTFWGNSWTCDKEISVRPDSRLKVYLEVSNNQSFPEQWDAEVKYYINETEHLILITSKNEKIVIEIHNNEFKVSGINTASITGSINDKVHQKTV